MQANNALKKKTVTGLSVILYCIYIYVIRMHIYKYACLSVVCV